MAIEVYEIADIAAILGIEKSRVKSWTIGRPFSVRPSVRAALGKGSRNLFSRNDVYCFALVQRLNEVGVPVAAIQGMLKKLRPNLAEDTFWQDQNWILITGKGQDFSYEIDLDAEYSTGFKLDGEQAIVCHYAVNVKLIAEAVSTRIHLLSHQQKGAALYEKAVDYAEPRWLKVGVAEIPGEGVAFSKIEPPVAGVKKTARTKPASPHPHLEKGAPS